MALTEKNCFVVLILLLLQCYIAGITVNTKLGNIVGSTKRVKVGPTEKDVAIYLGIPYAKAPIGDLRFSKPVSFGKFNESFNALEYSPACAQYFPSNDIGPASEDCLYLNIFSPDISQNGKKYPVMIWIHGGTFLFGSGGIIQYENIAVHGNVIIVSMNYRLGPPGFLNTGVDGVGANFGLWDQHTAIQWVHDNIDSFGGDINQITVFGESAGAAAVIYQAIYPPNEGLFQRVIASSGTATVPWGLVTDAEHKFTIYAERFGCKRTVALASLKCLRKLSHSPWMYSNSFISSFEGRVDWSPSVDGEFVTNERLEALKWPRSPGNSSFFNTIDIIMGTNGFEGQNEISTPPFLEYYKIFQNKLSTISDIEMAIKNVVKIGTSVLFYQNTTAMSILDDVLFEYSNFDQPLDKSMYVKKLVDILTDVNFYIPIFSTLANHAFHNNISKTYQYEFNELNTHSRYDDWVTGAIHGADVPYVFGSVAYAATENGNQSGAQWNLSSSLMTYWTNFAKTGNPNLPEKVPVEWKEFTEDKRNYLYLTSAEIKNGERLHARRTAFWLEHFPKLLDRVKREQEDTRILKEQHELDNIEREERNSQQTQTCGLSKTVNNSFFVTVLVVFVYVFYIENN